MTLYLGAPVWAAKEWVGNFFPPKSKSPDFLSLYSRRLNTVEGNTTFYALPNSETLDRWVADTPPSFRFCLKFPQTISHHLRLQHAEIETGQFLDCLTRLGERAGPAFLQLPPTFNAKSLPTLATYLGSLPDQFQYALEVRHPDFYAEPGEAAPQQQPAAGVHQPPLVPRQVQCAGPDHLRLLSSMEPGLRLMARQQRVLRVAAGRHQGGAARRGGADPVRDGQPPARGRRPHHRRAGLGDGPRWSVCRMGVVA